MQSNETQTIHPSRSAPLCCDCQHKTRHYCNHPAVPVDLVTGAGRWTCEDMRSDSMARSLLGEKGTKCGAAGALFAPQALPGSLSK